MLLTRKFIIGSLLFHVGLIVVACIVSLFDHTIKKTVVVYGAHSRKPSNVRYKSSKMSAHVPFVGGGEKSKLAKKIKSKKATRQKKIKRPVKKTSKQKNKKRLQETKKLPPAKFHELKAEPPKKHKKKHKEEIKKEAPEPEPIIEEEPVEEEKIEEKIVEKPVEESVAPEPEKEEPVEVAMPKEEVKEDEQSEQPEDADTSPEAGAENPGPDDAVDIDLASENNDADVEIYRKHVQEEVDRQWRPPLGVAKGTVCTVVYQIDNKGKVSSAEYLKRSPVLIYDLSIMRIEKSLTFHQCLWGKKIKVDFKQ